MKRSQKLKIQSISFWVSVGGIGFWFDDCWRKVTPRRGAIPTLSIWRLIPWWIKEKKVPTTLRIDTCRWKNGWNNSKRNVLLFCSFPEMSLKDEVNLHEEQPETKCTKTKRIFPTSTGNWSSHSFHDICRKENWHRDILTIAQVFNRIWIARARSFGLITLANEVVGK